MAVAHDTAFMMVELHTSTHEDEAERMSITAVVFICDPLMVVFTVAFICDPPNSGSTDILAPESHIRTPVSTSLSSSQWARQLPSTLANTNRNVVATRNHLLHTPIVVKKTRHSTQVFCWGWGSSSRLALIGLFTSTGAYKTATLSCLYSVQ